MKILSTTITTSAEETTANALYRLEYSVVNNKVSRVETSVISTTDNEFEEQQQLGYIIYENDNIHCSLPGNRSNSIHFAEFESILEEINSSVEEVATAETTQTSNIK